MTDTHHGTATTQLVPTTLPGIGQTYLDQSMVPKVNAFIANAAAHGVDLHFNSAFRTPDDQERLRHNPHAITPAEHSLHSAGFAVDVNYSTITSEAQREIIRTAAHDAGLKWGGNFQHRDPPHFYADPSIDRNTAIANATQQYNEMAGRYQAPVPAATHGHPGTPAHRQNAPHAPEQHPTAASSTRVSPRLNEASHPDYALFRQAYDGVRKLDAEHGRASDQHSENLAGSLTVEAKSQGLKRIDMVALSDDGSRAFAAEKVIPGAFKNIADVETAKAVNMPIVQSTQQIAQVSQAFQQQGQQANQQAAPVMQNGARMA